jgi:zinc protease
MSLSTFEKSLPSSANIHQHRLSNGLTVLVRENFANPSVVFDANFRAGGIFSQRKQAGLANFVSRCLMRGTQQYSFDQINEKVESIGASLSTSSGLHFAGFSGKCLAEDLESLLALSAEVIRRPTFPDEQVALLRQEVLTGLARRAHNTQAIAALNADELLFGAEHPYGFSGSGYPESISAITRQDLQNFHTRHYAPQGGVLVIVGAIAHQQAVAWAEQFFGDWENPTAPEIVLPAEVAPPAQPVRRFYPIPGKSQSDIIINFLGPCRKAPDFQAARLANSVLGQFGMMGRVGDIIRIKQGLAYYVYSSLTVRLGQGDWSIGAGVNPKNVEKAIESALHEVRRMTTELITEQELADNKSFFLGSLPLQLETNEGVCGSISNLFVYQLGFDYLLNLPNILNQITREEVLAAAQHYLTPQNCVITVAGS